MGGGHDEREQTLNQMLVEMDGFGTNEGIIVMAATNRVDILDPAIMRPGRFDRKITVSRPDVGGREEILKVHARNKPLSDDVDLKKVAQTTAGFTGADLENLLNESAINAAMGNRGVIKQEDIERAFIQVGIGTEKLDQYIQYLSFLQDWGQLVTQCHFLKRMKCLLPKRECLRISWFLLAEELQKRSFSATLLLALQVISKRQLLRPETWLPNMACRGI